MIGQQKFKIGKWGKRAGGGETGEGKGRK